MLNKGALSTRLRSPHCGERVSADPQTQGSPTPTPNSDYLQEKLVPHPIAKTGVGEGTAPCPGVLTPSST